VTNAPPAEPIIGEEIACGRLVHPERWRKSPPTYVQVFRGEGGWSVDLGAFFPDDFDQDGKERPTSIEAARKEALAYFRKVARRLTPKERAVA
jgi:hypothetical protein